MAHEVESLAYARQDGVPWHKLGLPVDESVQFDTDGMLDASGLRWGVTLAPMYVLLNGVYREVPQRKTVIRVTDGSILGTVGKRWRPLQNADAFRWFDPFVRAREARYVAAGSLRGGARVWVQAELCRDPLVLKRRNGPDDVIRKLLLLSNGHDGLMAVRCGFVPDRVICHNTLTAAHTNGASQLFRLTHTKKVEAALSAIRETINVVDGVFEATGELYRKLAQTDLDREEIIRYVKLVFDVDPDGDITERTQKFIDGVIAKVYNGLGNEGATAWDAYNGVTEALSHTVGRNRETRLNSLWYGDGAQTNRSAFSKALALV